jgi:hypothetical protein
MAGWAGIINSVNNLHFEFIVSWNKQSISVIDAVIVYTAVANCKTYFVFNEFRLFSDCWVF